MARVKVAAEGPKPTAEERTVLLPLPGETTNAPPAAEPDPEREAIQAEAREAEAARKLAREKEIAAAQNAAVANTLAARVPVAPEPPPPPVVTLPPVVEAALTAAITPAVREHRELTSLLASNDADIGDEVNACWGEETYGKPGSFSSFRVGPFSGTTRIRAGETRTAAHDRLYEDLRRIAEAERELKLASFLALFRKFVEAK